MSCQGTTYKSYKRFAQRENLPDVPRYKSIFARLTALSNTSCQGTTYHRIIFWPDLPRWPDTDKIAICTKESCQGTTYKSIYARLTALTGILHASRNAIYRCDQCKWIETEEE